MAQRRDLNVIGDCFGQSENGLEVRKISGGYVFIASFDTFCLESNILSVVLIGKAVSDTSE